LRDFSSVAECWGRPANKELPASSRKQCRELKERKELLAKGEQQCELLSPTEKKAFRRDRFHVHIISHAHALGNVAVISITKVVIHKTRRPQWATIERGSLRKGYA
jgi:hypothetical protein